MGENIWYKIIFKKFTSTVMRQLDDKMFTDKFSDWIKAFEYIKDKSNKERLFLVIDEFPYIAEANKSVLSILQNIIDHHFSKTKIFLILCGSQMSFMEDRILGYKSPLFGRKTAQMYLKPLNFYETMHFFENYSEQDII